MLKYPTMLLNLLLFSQLLICQDTTNNDLKKREEKLEIILKMQDTRTIYDGKLISFLSDNDPIVQERAMLAFASIQDTSVMNLLVGRLPDDAAVFAIGQTATQLSKKGRETLEHDIIWNRMDRPQDRLIEEIGIFGTEQALNDLIIRFGNVKPPGLTMSIARFAIRGIITREAIQYLLNLLKPAESTQWQVAYALQRIGNHSEIRVNLDEIVQLYKHRDPLVRMNLATLLGKVRDEKICLEPLQKLADFDNDWRVRVNALKSLSNYNLKGKDEIIRTFKRSFLAENMNVATTAFSAFGNTGLKKDSSATVLNETLSLVEKIAINRKNEYQWQLQAEAAKALSKIEGKNALPFIKITDGTYPVLDAQILIALSTTGVPEVSSILSSYLGNDKSILYRTAIEGLLELSKRNPTNTTLLNHTYDVSVQALDNHDVAITTAAAMVLGDSLFLRQSSFDPLINTLSRMHIPDDIEAIQEIISTLGKLKDSRAIKELQGWLNERDRSVVLAAASALKTIIGQDISSEIPKYFEPIYTDYDFKYLSALPETIKVKMETIRGDVVMELFKNYAPFTVMSFLKLATQRRFYSGLSFHRIVPNFVVQGGDPRGDGWGGPGYTIRSEFSPLTYETGTVGMASAGKDTEGSQFFITQSPQPHLDGRYTIFGKVISGMDIVNRIQLGDHIFDIKILP